MVLFGSAPMPVRSNTVDAIWKSIPLKIKRWGCISGHHRRVRRFPAGQLIESRARGGAALAGMMPG
jgi:hypothetical protein